METPTPWSAIAARGHLAVLLVRHGRTAWNDQGRFLGRTDIPLDPVGHTQAQDLARAVGPGLERVLSSPLARAHQTATAFRDEPEVADDLRELDQGELEGMKAPDAFGRWPEFFEGWARDPGAVTPPGGENLLACQERVLSVLDELAREHRSGGVIAAVSHQLAIASALCGLTGSPLTQWRAHRLENCAISVLEFDGRTWRIREHGWSVNNLGIIPGSQLPDV